MRNDDDDQADDDQVDDDGSDDSDGDEEAGGSGVGTATGADGSDDFDQDDGGASATDDTHRGVLAGVIDELQDNGVDVDDLAERAGISSADVNALSHDDLVSLAQYVEQNHPDVLQSVASRFPAAQGMLGDVDGGSSGSGGGGLLGGILGRFLGGGR
jgi:hypothetical protein